MQKIWVITLFPEFFSPLSRFGVCSRPFKEGKLELECVPLRNFSPFKYKNVDDRVYGGGAGMVIRADILKGALDYILEKAQGPSGSEPLKKILDIIYTTPQGTPWTHKVAKSFFKHHTKQHTVFIAGRYEGIDERFVEKYVSHEYSLGDFVLSGGEIPIMAMLDSAIRHLPKVLSNSKGLECESFENGLLEGPQYTRPYDFEGMKVPEILAGGHHEEIEKFRNLEAQERTLKRRPDLLKGDTADGP